MNAIKSEMVNLVVDGTQINGYLAQPAQPGPGVLVLHAWWGLNEVFKDLCRRLAQEGFTAFAPDLNNGQIATTIAGAEKLQQENDFERMEAVAKGAVKWLQQNSMSSGGLGMIGFSMGASWALGLASEMPEVARAIVLFYGLEGVDFSKLSAHLQGHFAESDPYAFENEDQLRQAETDIRAAGVQAEFFVYPGTGHWFFEPDRPDAYNEPAARLAWERSLSFLKQALAGRGS